MRITNQRSMGLLAKSLCLSSACIDVSLVSDMNGRYDISLINDIRGEFAREMLDKRWFIASKNGRYYTRYQLVPQKQLQELYTEVERIRKAYESTYGPMDHKLENEPTGKEAS